MATIVSASLEDYLEAILVLEREQRVARSRDIARRLKVSSAAVTGALRTLAGRRLVNYAPYGLITLTPRGKTLAGRVAHRHDVLRVFFQRVLQLDATIADETACRVEHAISLDVLNRLSAFMKLAEQCPQLARVNGAEPATCQQCPKRQLAEPWNPVALA